MKVFAVLLVCLASVASAGADLSADVVFLGEVHDNPYHHARQAALVGELAPKAIVFEMLDAGQAARVTPALLENANELGRALGWEEAGWPDFSMYYPIFTAAPGALVLGAAVPRDKARQVMEQGLASVFEGDAGQFGLTEVLPEDQQKARESLQLAAHCDALPQEMLPMMVDIQRLRDATLALVALEALDRTGGPVVVITGNGHARRDWGAPAALALAAPQVSVASLGQVEDGNEAPEGTFDRVEISPPVDREDPCAEFLKSRGN